jgi:hypothetical protein
MESKSYNELIEETYLGLSDQELWDFLLDSLNYLKDKKDTEMDDKQTDYFNKTADILKYCLKNKRVSFQQFKAINAFTRLISIGNVTYRELKNVN